MTEPDAGAELEQAGLDRRRHSLSEDSEPFGCLPHQQRLADGIGRRDLQQAPSFSWESVEPPPEALFDARRD